ncbi:Fe-S oxidoreductase [Peptoniphilus asaccharolyticus DSM 20463]|uniref:Fe-S oxidoreductase n=1 Tax=Peptoniphilus asaccharolyticus DSM 20463 TaxID=573058 RepID=A0A1W1V3F6_PEPAS|nr:(Fe-S)-binding protein [Peptoniphilus asaccharolyticus]MBL7576205.1 (Fe-S)-binding protein [Peptoniphilus asaccharolyticus]CRH93695.1 succinate dehydrogenase/fumarate reductase iron-sulfur subunit [Chlamydia trachomatis]SMB87823.1 Fe-S oxidoreductase [Peptoniphilus asaccharolyticus DSM 20463]
MIEKTRKECIECNLCTKHCSFLTEYEINLKEFTFREDLKDKCFMCDSCKHYCPKDLSGAEITKEFKSKSPNKVLRILKDPYLFNNNSLKKSKTLLFLGCNYPKYYPKTCEKLISIFSEKGMDFSVECCRKPLYENGIEPSTSLEDLLSAKETEKLVCVCPNCYHTLKHKLSIEVVSIYEFLSSENIGHPVKENANVFFPCSDKFKREIFKDIEPYLSSYETFKDINCCGLGGGVLSKNPDVGKQIKNQILNQHRENIYTYCSSCSYAFHKYGLENLKNILSEILDVNEKPSSKSVRNTLAFKFKNRK